MNYEKEIQAGKSGLCKLCGKDGGGDSEIDGVTGASVNFMMQKMTLEAPDERFDEVLEQAVAVCKKVEPDCKIVR